MLKRWIVGIALLFCGTAVVAAEAAELAKVRRTLDAMIPGTKPDHIQPSNVPGLYEVMYGADLIYITDDGRYVFEGNIYDVATRINLSERRRAGSRVELIRDVGKDNMIVFAPEQPKHMITVFTDIDCAYCRKLHRQMDEYNRLGIGVRYLFYPRAGPNSASFRKAVAVWCAKDRKQALTTAKAGGKIEMLKCPSPVRQHMDKGKQVGVSGTPTIILENGTKLPGYVSPPKLSRIIQQRLGRTDASD